MKFLTEKEQKECQIVFVGESKTIPDTSVKITEIVEKYTLPSYDQLMRIGMYDDELSANDLPANEIIRQITPLHNAVDFSELDDISEIRKALDRGGATAKRIQESINAQIKVLNDEKNVINETSKETE